DGVSRGNPRIISNKEQSQVGSFLSPELELLL
ncbi:MAG: hypothetical protein ACI9RP_002799, partial [Cyclobacteriaceae bacterium]